MTAFSTTRSLAKSTTKSTSGVGQGPITPSAPSYLQPGGTFTYLQPGGSFTYLQPEI